MADTKVIRIESILGGHSPMSHFAAADQFLASICIDPSYGFNNASNTPISTTLKSSGLLVPVPIQNVSGGTNAAPMWIKTNPKDTNIYVYDYQSSLYTTTPAYSSVTPLSDKGFLSGTGNGMEYYDNYMYMATATDLVRYGPLNGSPKFTGAYWTGVLSKTALTTPQYPYNPSLRNMPNHVLCRHSDGRLYIGDFDGARGVVHFVQTTKTSVEGDTDNGSTYGALTFGYGLMPTAIESYGSNIVVALYEGTGGVTSSRQKTAKISFWDTLSQNFNQIIWIEFPDQVITALKNIDGILYIFSSNQNTNGTRVSRYVGGYSVEEVAYIPNGYFPYPGGVDGSAQRLLFGSNINLTGSGLWPCVFSIGLQKSNLSQGLFAIMGSTNSATGFSSAVALTNSSNLYEYSPIFGTTNNTIEAYGTDYSRAYSHFYSSVYRIGQRFKIKKISIPLAQTISTNTSFIPTLYFDDGITSKVLTTVDNTSYPGEQRIVIRPDGAVGKHNFFFGIQWTGSALCVVGLPITIEYEIIDD